MNKYKNLFKPGRIGSMELKNRITMAPVCTKLGTENGAVNEKLINFYAERAKGGVSLIIIEDTCIEWPRGKCGENPIRIDDNKYVQGLNDLAEAVHHYGAKIATQLQHVGANTSVEFATEGISIIAPSNIPCKICGGDIPRPMKIEEIEQLIDQFIKAAIKTKGAGYDAVEIHGAHGYIITQFMSPRTNKRTDKYGGNFKNRMRLPVEIVRGIKKSVGDDFPVIFRFSADEFVQDGNTLKEGIQIAKALEDAGVDALDVSGGVYESMQRIFPTLDIKPGCNIYMTEEIKKNVKIPVIVVGRLGENLLLAEKALQDNKTDFIALGRSLLADPYLPNKAFKGKDKDIRPCLACNEACIGHVDRGWHAHCQVNPNIGLEKENKIVIAKEKKNILVIGGGPAGIQTSVISSSRKFKVTLLEKCDLLGGNLIPASIPYFKNSIKNYLEYLIYQIEKSEVNINLKVNATPEIIKTFKPDMIILATGSLPRIPMIKGVNKEDSKFASDVLLGKVPKNNEIIIFGGGKIGCELAWYLSDQNKKVKILEKQNDILVDTQLSNKMLLISKLQEKGVDIITGIEIIEIKDEEVFVKFSNSEVKTFFGEVVIACGYRSNKFLEVELRKVLPNIPVYSIGDCREAGRNIFGAVGDGNWISLHLEEILNSF